MLRNLIFTLNIFLVFSCKEKNALNPTWVPIRAESQGFLTDMAFTSEKEGIIMGYTWFEKGFFPRVDVFKTMDGGDNWSSLNFKYTGKYSYSHFLNISGVGKNIYFASNGAEIYKTIDGGLIWQYVGETLIKGTGDILFFNENIGITVGQGSINLTNDGSKSWVNVYNYNSETLNKNKDNILKAYDNLYIYGGKYFEKENDNTGNSGIIKSSNGGKSWDLVKTPFSQILDLFYLNDKIGFALGKGDYLYKTVNGGGNWEIIASVTGNKIYFVNEKEGYIFEDGKISHSMDGGITWGLEYESQYLKGVKKVISPDNKSICALVSSGYLIFKKK